MKTEHINKGGRKPSYFAGMRVGRFVLIERAPPMPDGKNRRWMARCPLCGDVRARHLNAMRTSESRCQCPRAEVDRPNRHHAAAEEFDPQQDPCMQVFTGARYVMTRGVWREVKR